MLLNVYGTVAVVSSSPLPLTAVLFYQLNFGEVRGIKVRRHYIIIKKSIHIENDSASLCSSSSSVFLLLRMIHKPPKILMETTCYQRNRPWEKRWQTGMWIFQSNQEITSVSTRCVWIFSKSFFNAGETTKTKFSTPLLYWCGGRTQKWRYQSSDR